MVTTQSYYLAAILALVLSGISLAVGLANLIIAHINRQADKEDKKESRAADQAYKYSKEVQNVLIEVERYKRQKCEGSDQVFYSRLKHLQYEEDWEIKQKITIINGFWRETIFLWNKGKLPDEFFEKQNIWLNRGNMYRLLLEPADIANHYGFKFFADSGHYLDGNRAGRYLFLEELWARRKNVTPACSIDFALLEQNLDQGACMNPVKVPQTTQPLWAANVGLTSRSLDNSRPKSFRQSSSLDIV